MALTRAAIVAAALGILERYGLADLSMRRVAESLGVQAGALYYHVPNKQSLLAAVADEVLTGLEGSASVGDWAVAYRRALLAVRDGAELVASTRAMRLGRVDPTLPARELLPPSGADHVVATFEHFVLGATLHDQTQAQLLALGLQTDFDADEAEAGFLAGLRILSRGAGIFIDSVA
jgi:TetR/AcrR family transcriptional regulator, tetracycline repressor protein